MSDESSKIKIVLKDLAKVQFDFENCTGFNDFEAYGNGYLQGYVEIAPNFHTFWLSAGGDWEHPVNFLFYWGDNRIRAYIPKDGNQWDVKYKTAYGSEMESNSWDDDNEEALEEEVRKEYAKVNSTSADPEKMIKEILNHIILHPKNAELIKKQPRVPTFNTPTVKPVDVPKQTPNSDTFDPERAIAYLNTRMNRAVKVEDYFLAAKCRDMITEIKYGKTFTDSELNNLS